MNARLGAQASVSHRTTRFQWDRIPVAESLSLLLLVKGPDKPDRTAPPLLPAAVYPHSPPLELVWLGQICVGFPNTEEVSQAWVMEGTGHFPWLSLFYSVSNLQVLEYLLLTLSGSLSYFRVNKSSLRHRTEQIQFVFMKNSPWKMGSIVYWLRLYSEPDSLQGHPSFVIHWTVWPWLSDCTSSLHFLINTWIICVPVS